MVQVFELDQTAPDHVAEDGTVAIVVRRDDAGIGSVVAVTDRPQRASWWLRQRDAGGSELHLHRLAESAEERAAIADDLTD